MYTKLWGSVKIFWVSPTFHIGTKWKLSVEINWNMTDMQIQIIVFATESFLVVSRIYQTFTHGVITILYHNDKEGECQDLNRIRP